MEKGAVQNAAVQQQFAFQEFPFRSYPLPLSMCPEMRCWQWVEISRFGVGTRVRHGEMSFNNGKESSCSFPESTFWMRTDVSGSQTTDVHVGSSNFHRVRSLARKERPLMMATAGFPHYPVELDDGPGGPAGWSAVNDGLLATDFAKGILTSLS